MTKNNIQHAIEQVGIDAVQKSLGTMALGNCDVHGHYLMGTEATCPLCPAPNGTTATQVEHFINVNPIDGTNPQQKINPLGF